MTNKQFYRSTAWKYASRYVLLFYSDGLMVKCCTCGKFMQINTKDCHCGHWIKYNEFKATAFEFENLGPQCGMSCNKNHSGRTYEFAKWIIKEHGYDALKSLSIKKHNRCKLDKLSMDYWAHHYKALFLKEVEKKGNPWGKKNFNNLLKQA